MTSMNKLGPVNPEFECVMVKPKKPIVHKSIKWTMTVKGTWFEGFTRDKNGKDRPNGLKFFMPEPGQFIPPGSKIRLP